MHLTKDPMSSIKIDKTKANNWESFYKLNNYYHRDLQNWARQVIPPDASVLEFSSRGGELLASLPNKNKVGVEYDEGLLELAKRQFPKINFIHASHLSRELRGRRFDYILLSHTSSDIEDLQKLLSIIKEFTHSKTRIVVSFFNFLWKPILDFGELTELKMPSQNESNWLTAEDLDNFFHLESYEKIKFGRRFLFPYKIPVISEFVNRYIAQLPLINYLCLNNFAVYRLEPQKKDYSVSIVIPARNEAGSLRGVLSKIPKLGKKVEVIFVEGHSKDDTYAAIRDEIKRYKGTIKSYLYKQKGMGKGDAVRYGFSKAKNEVLMILDADLTVDPKELVKFYKALSLGKGEFAMGSRLVYPMEKQAMRLLNNLANKFFSTAFTFILGQKMKDTLCGTKVLLAEDYEKIKNNRKFFGDFDPFGDFDLIFGAAKLNLKIVEIPIRYKERTYGKTNISRFRHGIILMKMSIFAARKIKFV